MNNSKKNKEAIKNGQYRENNKGTIKNEKIKKNKRGKQEWTIQRKPKGQQKMEN
jgi:hypothetical protein